jgi:hypothetical protein
MSKSSTPEERERIKALVAETKTAAEIGEIVGRSTKSVRYVVRAFDLGPWLGISSHAPMIKHIPEDFAERWAVMPQAALAEHYNRGIATICLWTKRLGLKRPVGVRAGFVPKAPAPKAVPRRTWGGQGGHKPTPTETQRDVSSVGLAVDYLRRFGPVNRCLPSGRLSPDGSLWLRGSTVLTDADVIERADWLKSRERIAA